MGACISVLQGPVCGRCGKKGDEPLWAMEDHSRSEWVLVGKCMCCKACVPAQLHDEWLATGERSCSSPGRATPASLPPATPLALRRASKSLPEATLSPTALHRRSAAAVAGWAPGPSPSASSLARRSMPAAVGAGANSSGPSPAKPGQFLNFGLANPYHPTQHQAGLPVGLAPSSGPPRHFFRRSCSGTSSLAEPPTPVAGPAQLRRYSSTAALLQRQSSSQSSGSASSGAVAPGAGYGSSKSLGPSGSSTSIAVAAPGGLWQPAGLARVSAAGQLAPLQARGRATLSRHSVCSGESAADLPHYSAGSLGRASSSGSLQGGSPTQALSWGEEAGGLACWVNGYAAKAALSLGGRHRAA